MGFSCCSVGQASAMMFAELFLPMSDAKPAEHAVPHNQDDVDLSSECFIDWALQGDRAYLLRVLAEETVVHNRQRKQQQHCQGCPQQQRDSEASAPDPIIDEVDELCSGGPSPCPAGICIGEREGPKQVQPCRIAWQVWSYGKCSKKCREHRCSQVGTLSAGKLPHARLRVGQRRLVLAMLFAGWTILQLLPVFVIPMALSFLSSPAVLAPSVGDPPVGSRGLAALLAARPWLVCC